jgi:hypothetical protein
MAGNMRMPVIFWAEIRGAADEEQLRRTPPSQEIVNVSKK